MNWVDVAIVVLVAWFTFSAFSAGIIREIVTIVGVALGIVLAGLFYKDLADDVKLAVDNDNAAGDNRLPGHLRRLFPCRAACRRCCSSRRPRCSMLGTFDHLFGAAFGFVKGMAVVELLLILFVTFPRFGPEEHHRSTRCSARCSCTGSRFC